VRSPAESFLGAPIQASAGGEQLACAGPADLAGPGRPSSGWSWPTGPVSAAETPQGPAGSPHTVGKIAGTDAGISWTASPGQQGAAGPQTPACKPSGQSRRRCRGFSSGNRPRKPGRGGCELGRPLSGCSVPDSLAAEHHAPGSNSFKLARALVPQAARRSFGCNRGVQVNRDVEACAEGPPAPPGDRVTFGAPQPGGPAFISWPSLPLVGFLCINGDRRPNWKMHMTCAQAGPTPRRSHALVAHIPGDRDVVLAPFTAIEALRTRRSPAVG